MATVVVSRSAGELAADVRAGSSFAALRLCQVVKPADFSELMRWVALADAPPADRASAFNAAADGYRVYVDGVVRGMLG